MDYQEATRVLFEQLPAFERSGAAGYKPGLDTSRALARMAGDPQMAFPTVHVAGTNGKGSTSSMLASVLSCAGYRVGLYTSPHLVDFRERIRVDGRMISAERVVEFVESFYLGRPEVQRLHPTFFELTTILAFQYFAEQQVDIAIIETGLGGRLDTTNIITPLLSVITNVSLDHTDLLGHTLGAIAAEKAGIIKPGVPVIIGPRHDPEVERVLRAKAAECRSELMRALVVEGADPGVQPWQRDNRATVRTAAGQLRRLGFAITDAQLEEGIADVAARTGLRGRWTVVSRQPLTVYDTGHNPGAWEQLGPAIAAHPGPRHVVVGFVADKDVAAILRLMPPTATYYFTAPHSHRALSADELARMGAEAGLHGSAYADVAEAYQAAIQSATADALVLIGGSNYLIGEWLLALGQGHRKL